MATLLFNMQLSPDWSPKTFFQLFKPTKNNRLKKSNIVDID